jgi:LPXTG-site transpeptidase (sortase) family protein
MRIQRRHTPFGLIALGTATLSLTLLSGCGGAASKSLSVAASPTQTTRLSAHTVAGDALQAPASATPAATQALAVHAQAAVDNGSPVRLVIPRIGVNAPFVTLGLVPGSKNNQMDSPKTKDDVGYYNFTPLPGHGGNTVVGGHVDWYTGQTGVFWELKKLAPGDEIRLQMQDGTVYRYQVTTSQVYDDAGAPVAQIVGPTSKESVTLLTCEGTFSHTTAEYDKERVVRAERIG